MLVSTVEKCCNVFLIFVYRIYLIKINIGMRHASSATSVACHWLTSNSARKPIKSTVAIAMMLNLHLDVMAVVKYFVLVSFSNILLIIILSHFYLNDKIL